MHARLWIAIALCLGGCAHMDTGEIDYRRSEAEPSFETKVASYQENCLPENKPAQGFRPKRKSMGSFKEIHCQGLLPAKLFRKNAALGTPISPGDVYSVRLDHGLIAYITEPKFSTRRLTSGKNPFRKVGEIVVLANIFEFSPSDAEASAVKGFYDFNNFSEAKVVYYNPDVEEGQDLNFSNIPLQAPTEYGGRPVGIQIVVMELDGTSEQMSSLLKKLSLMGQESNLLPGGPVASTLLKLGTSLLTQNHDDTIFEYRFVLDPADGRLNAVSSPFEAARYVIRRTDDRREDQNWRNIILDHNTGKLLWSTPPVDEPVPFERDTYFTINVMKHPDKRAKAAFGFKTMAALRTEIEQAANDRDQPLGEVTDMIAKKTTRMRATKWGADLAEAWDSASGRYVGFAQSAPPLTAPSGCTLKPVEREKTQLAEIQARSAAIAFIRLYAQAIAAKEDDNTTDVFTDADRQKILDSMAPFFLPISGDMTIADLTMPAIFEKNFVSDDSSAFQDAMLATALVKFQPTTCNELLARGLAELPPQPIVP